MAAYRAFGLAHGWEVLGLYQDLSQRYPVAPLLGARSAQAELALTGQWDGWSAVVASVLVRPPARSDGRPHVDTIVQLTTLDTGPFSPQFSAAVGQRGTDVALLSSGSSSQSAPLERVLEQARAGGDLWPGDHLAADEVELLHTRALTTAPSDLAGPLRLLSSLACKLA
jgi:hypothetical protein